MLKKFVFALMLSMCSICAAQETNFDILATTHSDGAALTLIRYKDEGSIFFAVTDAKSQSLAFVQYSPKVYNFYLNRSEYGEFPPLMFVLICPEEARGGTDEALGVWSESAHMLPVYALFDVKDGQIIFDAPNFYSARDTLQPSHYHSDISEPIHSRLIEIFMLHMPELHRQVQAQGVVLP